MGEGAATRELRDRVGSNTKIVRYGNRWPRRLDNSYQTRVSLRVVGGRGETVIK